MARDIIKISDEILEETKTIKVTYKKKIIEMEIKEIEKTISEWQTRLNELNETLGLWQIM